MRTTYTYVWRKNAERYKASTLDKIRQLLSSLDGLIEREEQADQCSATDSAAKPQLSDSKAVEQAVERINEQIGQAEQCLCPEVGSEQQFIVNYTIHQTPSDMVSFEPHLNDTLKMLDSIGQSAPENVVADAGYGSEHNYAQS